MLNKVTDNFQESGDNADERLTNFRKQRLMVSRFFMLNRRLDRRRGQHWHGRGLVLPLKLNQCAANLLILGNRCGVDGVLVANCHCWRLGSLSIPHNRFGLLRDGRNRVLANRKPMITHRYGMADIVFLDGLHEFRHRRKDRVTVNDGRNQMTPLVPERYR